MGREHRYTPGREQHSNSKLCFPSTTRPLVSKAEAPSIPRLVPDEHLLQGDVGSCPLPARRVKTLLPHHPVPRGTQCSHHHGSSQSPVSQRPFSGATGNKLWGTQVRGGWL